MSNQDVYKSLIELLDTVNPFHNSGHSIPAERAFISIDVWVRFRALVESLQLGEEVQHVSCEKRAIYAIKFPDSRRVDGVEQWD
ncbi:hypothetical protein LQE85_06300 [Stenotrophomonas rhizophila]|uniref:hypothetical protein n=1 Tax=Stenotrophomonas rhizophila TaxID=216778 RepID=UPI00201CC86C|nr:hypothetical protein [Stenotrophomonas rhizophila]UQY88824.1 hypothetical protein LQE85_06300 [Stenotrophomonas rhizophila]